MHSSRLGQHFNQKVLIEEHWYQFASSSDILLAFFSPAHRAESVPSPPFFPFKSPSYDLNQFNLYSNSEFYWGLRWVFWLMCVLIQLLV